MRMCTSFYDCILFVYFWYFRNFANSVLKGVAWLYTGSYSMFSEMVHSAADTLNQVYCQRKKWLTLAADTLVYLLYGSLGCQYFKSGILSEIVHSAANR